MKPVQKKKNIAQQKVAHKLRQTILEQLNGIPSLPVFIILAIAIFATFNPTFKNELTLWDDNAYVRDNKNITENNPNFLINVFSIDSSNVMGNYHPLTVLSFKMNYKIGKLDATIYQATNISLHVLNAFLVFLLIVKLSGRRGIAFLTAVLFAIHPMHVESVAWVSEHKDLLYTFFWLLALITYLNFLGGKHKQRDYALTIFLFILSGLSKGMAITLPFALLLVDYYKGRSLKDKKVIIEKIPFFVLAVIFGFIAMEAQKVYNAINADIPLYIRMLYAGFGYVNYVIKLFLPFNQHTLYYVPELEDTYPYISHLIIAIALFGSLLYIFRKDKDIVFGILFFVIIMLPVSQIISVGQAIMADRYTYIPYIGLFYVLFILLYRFLAKPNISFAIKQTTAIVLLLIFSAYAVKAYNRCSVWKDTISITTDALDYKQFGVGCEIRGSAYFEQKKYKEAMQDFSIASTDGLRDNINYYFLAKCYALVAFDARKTGDVAAMNALLDSSIQAFNMSFSIDSAVVEREQLSVRALPFYENVAYFYYVNYFFDQAAYYYSKALAIDPQSFDNLKMRGTSYVNTTNIEKGIADLTQAISLKPDDTECYLLRANTLSKINRFAEALPDYDFYINKNKENSDAYAFRAMAYFALQNTAKALEDFNISLRINPSNFNAYLKRGVLFYQENKYDKAINDLNAAAKLNANISEIYSWRGMAYQKLNLYSQAIADYSKAIQLNPNDQAAILNRANTYKEIKKFDLAVADAQRLRNMGYTVDVESFGR